MSIFPIIIAGLLILAFGCFAAATSYDGFSSKKEDFNFMGCAFIVLTIIVAIVWLAVSEDAKEKKRILKQDKIYNNTMLHGCDKYEGIKKIQSTSKNGVVTTLLLCNKDDKIITIKS